MNASAGNMRLAVVGAAAVNELRSQNAEPHSSKHAARQKDL
jgi:hypothetical protein